MKKFSLLLVGLLCLSVVVYAGDVITNDTGETATGLRVTFSAPVIIVGFGDILTSVDPQMLSFEFVFSGGTVKPWGSHWFNYAPTTASIVESEWLIAKPSTTGASDSSTEDASPTDSSSTWSPWGSDPNALDFRFVLLGQLCHEIFYDYPQTYRAEILSALEEIKALGFKGVSVNFTYFLDTEEHVVFSCYERWACGHAWRFSPQDWMIEVLFECMRDVGLDGDLRLEVVVPNIGDAAIGSRATYFPSRNDAEKFFQSYEDLALRLAYILERTEADVFSVFTELPLIEHHTDLVKHTLDVVADIFSGELIIEQHTYLVLWKLFPEIHLSGDMSGYEAYCGNYWDWEHADGRKVIIGYSWWPGPARSTYIPSDNLGITYSPSIEAMTRQIVPIWQNLVDYHRTRYPSHKIVFAEVGIYNFGDQEMANMWAAYLAAMEELKIDGFNIWSIALENAPTGWKSLTLGHDEIYGEPVISAITPFLGETDDAPPVDWSFVDNRDRTGDQVILFDEAHGNPNTLLWNVAAKRASENSGNSMWDLLWDLRDLEPDYAWLPQEEPVDQADLLDTFALAFATPAIDLDESEYAAINEYLDEGGVVLFFGDANYQLPPRFTELLAGFGVSLDPNSNLRSGVAISTALNYAEYIVENGQQLLFEEVEGVELVYRSIFRGKIAGSEAWILVIARKGAGTVVVLGDNEFALGHVNYMRELLDYLWNLQ